MKNYCVEKSNDDLLKSSDKHKDKDKYPYGKSVQ